MTTITTLNNAREIELGTVILLGNPRHKYARENLKRVVAVKGCTLTVCDLTTWEWRWFNLRMKAKRRWRDAMNWLLNFKLLLRRIWK